MRQRVLVTGGGGFIGSHLVETLLRSGRSVTVLDDFSTGRRENLEAVRKQPGLRIIEGDVRDTAAVAAAAEGASLVFHLAAAVGVRLIVEAPVRTIATNVDGTQVVLEEAVRRRAKVVLASSSEVYGKGDGHPYREDDDLVLGPSAGSRWSYAASKIVAEHLALASHREAGLPVVIARLFNTVGPRQVSRYGMVLPSFVEAARAGKPIRVFGDGLQTRAFAAVDEVVQALIELSGGKGGDATIVNVGSSAETTILDLARLTKALTESPSEIVLIPYVEAYGAGFEDLRKRVPDVSRLRSLLGWVPSRSVGDIIRSL